MDSDISSRSFKSRKLESKIFGLNTLVYESRLDRILRSESVIVQFDFIKFIVMFSITFFLLYSRNFRKMPNYVTYVKLYVTYE